MANDNLFLSLSSQRSAPKNPFAISQPPQFRLSNLADTFPRTFHPAMGSPLPESFALWPPTPRTNGNRPATVHEASFSYSLPEDCSAATTSWDPNCLSMGLPSENHNMESGGADMSQQYEDSSLDSRLHPGREGGGRKIYMTFKVNGY